MTTKRRLGVNAVVLLALAAARPAAVAAVNLVLRPGSVTVDVGEPVTVGLFAVSDDGTDQDFTGLDVVLTWDPVRLELMGVNNDGPHNWGFVFGFEWDEGGDRLNADCGPDSFCEPYTGVPFGDGDALFQAASFSPATATEEGILVGTLRFIARMPASTTQVVIVPSGGDRSTTRVLQPGAVDVTGELGDASLSIVGGVVEVGDFTMAAGGRTEIFSSGWIDDIDTIGVTVILEIVPRSGVAGSVQFTQAIGPEDVDIAPFSDPWSPDGVFQAFDTDQSGSVARNGVVLSDGLFEIAPLVFSGPLAAFPIVASPDARGVWDVMLCLAPCSAADSSAWESSVFIPTALLHGTVTAVPPGDGDGNGTVVLRDFSEFQGCFTGARTAAERPAYSLTPQLRCGVYDLDQDYDIDHDDYRELQDLMSSSGP